MRLVVIVKANEQTEAGVMPSTELFAEMGAYNDELVEAGIMVDAHGRKASSHGRRVLFSGDERTVVDGPFAETKELLAGYWIWDVDSMDQAVEWATRCPNTEGGESALEIRPFFEAEELGDLAGLVAEQGARIRAATGEPTRSA